MRWNSHSIASNSKKKSFVLKSEARKYVFKWAVMCTVNVTAGENSNSVEENHFTNNG